MHGQRRMVAMAVKLAARQTAAGPLLGRGPKQSQYSLIIFDPLLHFDPNLVRRGK